MNLSVVKNGAKSRVDQSHVELCHVYRLPRTNLASHVNHVIHLFLSNARLVLPVYLVHLARPALHSHPALHARLVYLSVVSLKNLAGLLGHVDHARLVGLPNLVHRPNLATLVNPVNLANPTWLVQHQEQALSLNHQAKINLSAVSHAVVDAVHAVLVVHLNPVVLLRPASLVASLVNLVSRAGPRRVADPLVSGANLASLANLALHPDADHAYSVLVLLPAMLVHLFHVPHLATYPLAVVHASDLVR